MVSGNKFSGTLPSSLFSKAVQLKNFYAQSNQLSGTIPDSVGNNKKWMALDISHNALNGTIPSPGKWHEIEGEMYISLNNNELTGTIPWSLFQRPSGATFATFLFGTNHLDVCNLPMNYQFPQNMAYSFSIGGQTPQECGCADKWPLMCTGGGPMSSCSGPQVPLHLLPRHRLHHRHLLLILLSSCLSLPSLSLSLYLAPSSSSRMEKKCIFWDGKKILLGWKKKFVFLTPISAS